MIHPYDWTFTPTDYKGTLTTEEKDEPEGKGWKDPPLLLRASPTTQAIDYEQLKVQEKILFYQDLILFEDELDDNGCSALSTKIVRPFPISSVFLTFLVIY